MLNYRERRQAAITASEGKPCPRCGQTILAGVPKYTPEQMVTGDRLREYVAEKLEVVCSIACQRK